MTSSRWKAGTVGLSGGPVGQRPGSISYVPNVYAGSETMLTRRSATSSSFIVNLVFQASLVCVILCIDVSTPSSNFFLASSSRDNDLQAGKVHPVVRSKLASTTHDVCDSSRISRDRICLSHSEFVDCSCRNLCSSLSFNVVKLLGTPCSYVRKGRGVSFR
jgi:hypothetical protein